ncbi:putative retinoid-inducible serine carboxypeptidase-like [Apostichopus japonicus]|uniref:Putative retinoid-inducible serine carboxypeptidase-like n=1 Tax=Stichopus japonicus TaxID=307972 RepID=A0A2G8KUG9_STIJA|nr:putative retinoid-inducible serine carboxypeptidase-like [Apostichopus japonicus]
MELRWQILGRIRPYYLPNVKCDPNEDWGYVDVRPGAHMFWWLYSTTADPSTNPPLIIWLQLQKASLLFIDNPVGSGYSYVDNDDAYTTNVTGIANDLMTLLKTFLQKQPSFQAIQSGEIKANFKGCALGDSWISPIDSLLSWGPYLYHTSLVDKPGLAQVNAGAQKAKQLLDEGQYAEATTEFGILEDIIEEVTDGVNVYNILQFDQEGLQSRKHHKQGFKLFDRLYNRHVGVYYANDDLSELMNGPIKKKLGIPENVTWGGQSKCVCKQAVDFMKSVQDIGTEAWVNNLKWSGLSTWNATQWQSVKVNEQRTGFYKTFKNFSFSGSSKQVTWCLLMQGKLH